MLALRSPYAHKDTDTPPRVNDTEHAMRSYFSTLTEHLTASQPLSSADPAELSPDPHSSSIVASMSAGILASISITCFDGVCPTRACVSFDGFGVWSRRESLRRRAPASLALKAPK